MAPLCCRSSGAADVADKRALWRAHAEMQLRTMLEPALHSKIDTFLDSVAEDVALWRRARAESPELQNEPGRREYVAQLHALEVTCGDLLGKLAAFDFAGRPADMRHVVLQSELRCRRLPDIPADPMLEIIARVAELRASCASVASRFPTLEGKPKRPDRIFVQRVAVDYQRHFGVAPKATPGGAFFELINVVLPAIRQEPIGDTTLREFLRRPAKDLRLLAQGRGAKIGKKSLKGRHRR